MITINKYVDIYDIAKNNNDFIINLSNLSIRERLRVIDFLSGLIFKHGKIEKLSSDTFKISL